MKHKKKFLIMFISLSLIFIFPVSSSAAFSKNITLKWSSTTINKIIEPNNVFIPGKTVSSTNLRKEAQEWCLSEFPFTTFYVSSASGKIVGSVLKKNMKFYSTFVSGQWRENEYGEDEYSLNFNCFGSISTVVRTKSSYYSLTIEERLWDYFAKKYRISTFVDSPNFSINDLDSNSGVLTLKVTLTNSDDDSNLDGYNFEWIPAGSE